MLYNELLCTLGKAPTGTLDSRRAQKEQQPQQESPEIWPRLARIWELRNRDVNLNANVHVKLSAAVITKHLQILWQHFISHAPVNRPMLIAYNYFVACLPFFLIRSIKSEKKEQQFPLQNQLNMRTKFNLMAPLSSIKLSRLKQMCEELNELWRREEETELWNM